MKIYVTTHQSRTGCDKVKKSHMRSKHDVLCDHVIKEGEGHDVYTMNINDKVCEMATYLNKAMLLSKLSSGDMRAPDASYHKNCMTELYTEYRSFKRKDASLAQVTTSPESTSCLNRAELPFTLVYTFKRN